MRPCRSLASITLSGLLLFAVGCSRAATPAEPAVLATLKDQGIHVAGEFAAPVGVRAFAGEAGDTPIAIYVLPDGSAVVGRRLDAKGKLLDQERLAVLVAKPAADRVLAMLEKASWIPDGKDNAARIVYVFTDPNCPYCHRFWEAARPWVDAGKVQLRHLLVGVIREDSAAKAAAIMASTDPAAALRRNEMTQSSGGINALGKIPTDIERKLASNEQLMMTLGFQGTPGIVTRGSDGGLRKVNGLPQGDVSAEVLGPL